MVNMELVHGLERAKEILADKLHGFEEKMKEYEDIAKELFNGLGSTKEVLYYTDIINDYRQMYRDYKLKADSLEYAIYEIEDEIEKEMSVDCEGETA